MSETTRPEERTIKWLRQLRGADEVVRAHAAMRLTTPGLDAEAARAGLREALQDADAEVRRLAAWVLARGARKNPGPQRAARGPRADEAREAAGGSGGIARRQSLPFASLFRPGP
jgi:hypothetical protein